MNNVNRIQNPTGPYIQDRSRIESYARQGKLQPEAALAFQAKYPNDLYANEITADILSSREANGHALAFRKRAVLISRFAPAQVDKFARACYDFGLLEDLGVILREAAKQHPGSPSIAGFLAEYHSALGQMDKAISGFEEAIQSATDERHRLRLKQELADIMLKSDRAEPALKILHDLLPTRDHQVFALCRIAEFEKADLQSTIVQKIGQLLNQPQSKLSDEDRVALHLAYGTAAETSNEFDLAFQSWEKAHAIDVPPYDTGQMEAAYRTNMEFYTDPLFQRTRSSANPSHAPVFVMGMPRSGTTLVEQILGAHTQCEGVGETGRMVFMNTAFLNKYHRPGGAEAFSENVAKGELVTRGEDFLNAARLLAGREAQRFIDKTPTQFVAAGYIHLCLPHAKFINMERHPADIFISTYQNQFSRSSAYPWTQERFAHFYLQREELLKHWRSLFGQQILDVRYEDVASDPEPQIRRMLAFLELEWDPACLRFQESGKTIHTFSRQQVRSAINTKSVQRWRNYEKHLGPLLLALEKAGYKYGESDV